MFHEYFTIIFHRYLQINIPFTYSSNFQRVLLTVDSVAQELKEKNKIKRSESTGPSRTINSRQQPPKHHGFHVVKKKKKNHGAVQREIMLLRPVGQIRVVVSSHTWKPDFILSGSQVARASRGRRLVLGSETNCAPDNLHGRSILGPERDSQESCFAVNGAALCSLRGSEKGR